MNKPEVKSAIFTDDFSGLIVAAVAEAGEPSGAAESPPPGELAVTAFDVAGGAEEFASPLEHAEITRRAETVTHVASTLGRNLDCLVTLHPSLTCC
jgi:hypothetical protein